MILFFPYGSGSLGSSSSTATSVNQLIKDALAEIGIVGQDGVLSPENAAYGLRLLQQMYGSFNAKRLFLFHVERETHELTAGQQDYTVGPDGDFDRERPQFISHVGVLPVGTTRECPVELISRADWLTIADKTQTDAYPRLAHYEPTHPLGTFSVWPIPTTAADFVLATALAIGTPASLTLTTEIVLPDAYYESWRLELAKRYNRPFGNNLRGEDLRQLHNDARDATGIVLRMNDTGPSPQTADPALLSGHNGYDIRTGRQR